MGSILPTAETQFLNNIGLPLVGGKVYFYQPGTENPATTWKDSALTIPNTNPVVLDSAGRAIIWGNTTYRQVVQDRFGITLFDQITSDFSSAALAASLAGSTGSSLVGFQQLGTGSVVRTVQDKLRDTVSILDFGAVGDGSNETAKVQAALNASVGKILELGAAMTYGISSVNIPSDVTIVSNGSKFSKLAASITPGITGGVRLTADRLWLIPVGGTTDFGINLTGGSVNIGEIRVESAYPDSGTDSAQMNAFLLGPVDGSTYSSRDKIGSIFTSNFSRPIVFQNLSHTTVGMIQVTSYKRAVYVHNCQNMVLNGGDISGRAASSTGEAGDNGLLVDGTTSGATADVYVSNWSVQDSGEHAYRLGGTASIRGFWGSSLSAYRPGVGGIHGGCGFKALGNIPSTYHYDVYLDDFYMEDGNPAGGNYCGVQFGLVDGCQVNNPIIRSNNNATSCYDGISILSCNNVQVNNPIVKNASNLGARFYTASDAGYPNGSNDCYIDGGYLDTADTGGPVVQFDGNGGNLNAPMVRSGLRGNTLLRRGLVAAAALPVTTGGVYTDCFLDFTYFDSTGAGAILQGTSAFLVDITLNDFSSNNATPAGIGSTMRSTSGPDNRPYIKSAIGWGPTATSFQVTLADQTAISWTPPAGIGWYLVTGGDITHFGQVYARSAPVSTTKIAGGSQFAVAITALTGTTGTAGNVTLSTFGGLMYLENRAGNSLAFTIVFMG